MNRLLYDQLTATLARRGGAFPVINSQVLYDLLDLIFSDDDAELAVRMSDVPVTAEDMAGLINSSVESAKNGLEAMAQKGIIASLKLWGKRMYVLLPMIPGILENQMVKGEVNERARQIAKLTYAYLDILKELEKEKDDRIPTVPFARVIPIEQNIEGQSTVQPYDRLLEYIDKTDNFAQTVCHCRHAHELMGDTCSKPKDVCLAVGPGAQYMIEYGMGKAVSKEEVREILKRAEDAGLVHVVSNTGKNIDFICNCCICHCETLQSFKRFADYGRAARSSFITQVNADECIGCGVCIERCPMDALFMQDEKAILDKKACIGCGLCISTCPAEAITMISREGAAVPYENVLKLNKAIISSTKSEI